MHDVRSEDVEQRGREKLESDFSLKPGRKRQYEVDPAKSGESGPERSLFAAPVHCGQNAEGEGCQDRGKPKIGPKRCR